MTVASEQCVIVGVSNTVTVVRPGEGAAGVSKMSESDTTAREPNVSGCSGSEIVEMRSGRRWLAWLSRVLEMTTPIAEAEVEAEVE
jgi:hypothetical protein